jgi:hypothetical protein
LETGESPPKGASELEEDFMSCSGWIVRPCCQLAIVSMSLKCIQ